MNLQESFKSTILLKAVALIIGFLFWSTLRDSFTATKWLQVPVCFYNRTSQQIEAPEMIWVELKGRRAHLRTLDIASLAVHIDMLTLHAGPNMIQVTADSLFLPTTIAVGDIVPHNILVTVKGAT